MFLYVKFYRNNDIILPLHYNHILQATIYNIIDSKLSDFLHNEGFGDSRKFKMFTFSRLFGKFDIKTKPGYIVFDKEVNITIASPYGKFCQSFANGIIKNKIKMADNELEVVETNLTPIEVNEEEIVVETHSPIVTYSTLTKQDGSKYTVYFEPKEKEFAKQIDENIKKKYEAFFGRKWEGDSLKIEPLSKTKQHIINYKDFIIKGYSGIFKLSGPKELIKLGLEAGLGAKNSMGFGCVGRKG